MSLLGLGPVDGVVGKEGNAFISFAALIQTVIHSPAALVKSGQDKFFAKFIHDQELAAGQIQPRAEIWAEPWRQVQRKWVVRLGPNWTKIRFSINDRNSRGVMMCPGHSPWAFKEPARCASGPLLLAAINSQAHPHQNAPHGAHGLVRCQRCRSRVFRLFSALV